MRDSTKLLQCPHFARSANALCRAGARFRQYQKQSSAAVFAGALRDGHGGRAADRFARRLMAGTRVPCFARTRFARPTNLEIPMAYIHPDAVEHHRKRWLRHDAYRFAAPGTPEADPGLSHPWAEVARREQAAADEAKARALAEQDEFERKVLALRAANARVRIMLADLKFELALRALGRKYREDQPRVPAGSGRESGRWTDGGGSGAGRDDADAPQDSEALHQDRRLLFAPGPGQEPRRDLVDLDAIANHPPIRSRIDEAWAASDPNGFGRENGFWISRNNATGELFTRPFVNPGGPAMIVPGPPPSDAIAFFHTHPTRPEFVADPGPSPEDRQYAARLGLPGLLQSHSGMYYFGPLLRPRR
jgi:hypothetical protein